MSAEWLHWYYLIYWLPGAFAVLVLLMSGLGGHQGGHGHAAHGGLHLHGHHGGVHTAHAGEVHAGHAGGAHGGHAHAGAHPAAHGHGSHAGHHGSHPSPSIGRQLLGFFGLGRAPITIVASSLLLGWGLCGLGATELLRPILHYPALFVLPSLAVASAGGLVSAKLFGELAARLMPQDESYAISREGFLGLTGKVVYPVSETAGRVHIFDRFRTLHVASARVLPGQPPLAKGTEVIVASLDPDRGTLIVEPLGFSGAAITGKTAQEARNHESAKLEEVTVVEGGTTDG